MRYDVPAARRALVDALAMADTVDGFAETQRANQKDILKTSRVGLPP